MGWFEKILENTWFVGIVGGIISGLLVYYITDKFFNSQKDIEYRNSVTLANNEIAQGIKVFFIQQHPLKREIITALINSTAKKYDIQVEDLFSLSEIADFLIKDIIETSFLAVENKKKLCESINEVLRVETVDCPNAPKVESKATSRPDTNLASSAMGLMAALFSLLLFFKQQIGTFEIEFSLTSSFFFRIISLLVAAAITALFASALNEARPIKNLLTWHRPQYSKDNMDKNESDKPKEP